MGGGFVKFSPFSKKQMAALTWWQTASPYCGADGILCDGAVRSGKTLCMSLSFVAWSFAAFSTGSFAFCGKTVTSLQRNLVTPLTEALGGLGFSCRETRSRGLLEIRKGRKTLRFYLFGGRDAGSAALIQGVTLSGILLDEVALMPRSFVEQALARCSVSGSKFWFNCNPEYPGHWFYKEWVKKAEEKNVYYLHFRMEDNPSLTPDILKRYETLYTGAFYERFVLGKWVAAQGQVYPMFEERLHVASPPEGMERYWVSCDYGTVNPCSMGLWGEKKGTYYRVAEYYHDARLTHVQHTDEEYYRALLELCGRRKIEAVIVDPSAASFITLLRRYGRLRVLPGKNDVLFGIGRVSDALREGKLRFSPACRDTLREFSLYRWKEEGERDAPRKEFDHAMDDIRYFVTTVLEEAEDWGGFSMAVERR